MMSRIELAKSIKLKGHFISAVLIIISMGCDTSIDSISWYDQPYLNFNIYEVPLNTVESVYSYQDNVLYQKELKDLQIFFSKIIETFSNSNFTKSEAERFYSVLQQKIYIQDHYPIRTGSPPVDPIFYPDRMCIKKLSTNQFLSCYYTFGSGDVDYFYLNIYFDHGVFSTNLLENWIVKT